uniref:CRAL-TRIO domain-containing protein n=2 Tax=Pseudo-nitzschia australis TaxID=44445 RepID=A0A6U9Z194_9STRA|mmetsp:Transcript_27216/g.56997  ORF Transcript_27216/g.56997 Transcript_27216/m.56997 type:complete len:490 (-) Transcript_27216:785-2254(-)
MIATKNASININGPWHAMFPSNMHGPPDRNLLDSMLAKEFLSFSFQDRNEINEEVHGVICRSPTETPKLITNSLEQLDFELDMMPINEKKMYAMSQTIYGRKNSSEEGGSYVNDSEFRLRFLRIGLFDARIAAQKLVSFLANICDLFGEYALKRPILLSDFTEEELHIFRMGNLQLLPFRDRSGRRIIAGVEGLAIQFDSNVRFKIMFYLCWVAGLDLETQSKGVVVIIWPVADVAMNHIKNEEHMIQLQKERLKGSPIRTCAFHFCVPDTPLCYVLRTIFALTLDKTKRCRLKFHIGHLMELRYLVKGYGIPVDHIPLTETGNVKTQNLRIWMKLRSTLEEGKDGATNIIECPGSNDVLFRPSKLIKGHPGNVKFESLIEYYHEIGLGVTAASKEIIAVILKDDGRILVWDKRGWWTKLIDPAQRQFKVSVSYRDYKKKNKAKLQVSNSSTFVFQQNKEGKKRRRLTCPSSSCPSSNSSLDTLSSSNY